MKSPELVKLQLTHPDSLPEKELALQWPRSPVECPSEFGEIHLITSLPFGSHGYLQLPWSVRGHMRPNNGIPAPRTEEDFGFISQSEFTQFPLQTFVFQSTPWI